MLLSTTEYRLQTQINNSQSDSKQQYQSYQNFSNKQRLISQRSSEEERDTDDDRSKSFERRLNPWKAVKEVKQDRLKDSERNSFNNNDGTRAALAMTPDCKKNIITLGTREIKTNDD